MPEPDLILDPDQADDLRELIDLTAILQNGCNTPTTASLTTWPASPTATPSTHAATWTGSPKTSPASPPGSAQPQNSHATP